MRSSQSNVNSPSLGSRDAQEKTPTVMTLHPASFIRRTSSSHTSGVSIH